MREDGSLLPALDFHLLIYLPRIPKVALIGRRMSNCRRCSRRKTHRFLRGVVLAGHFGASAEWTPGKVWGTDGFSFLARPPL